jgi:hypothetical protein
MYSPERLKLLFNLLKVCVGGKYAILCNFEMQSNLHPSKPSFSGGHLKVVVSHQWCDLFYRLLHSPTRHIEKVEEGERDTQVVHVNEATAV